MKKSNLIKCTSLVLALAPAAVLASCGKSGADIPSNYVTVGIGDLWVSKKSAGKNFDFKVTVRDSSVNYNVAAAVITGDNPENYEINHLIDPTTIKIVDQYNGHITATEVGTFSITYNSDVYFSIKLDNNLAADQSLAFVASEQYNNEDGSEVFSDIDLAYNNKFITFGCYINQGTPIILDGANLIDKDISPVFVYTKATVVDEELKTVLKGGFLDRREFEDGTPYFVGCDFDSEKELVLDQPTAVYGIVKLNNLTSFDDTIELTSLITLNHPKVDSTFCYADVQKGETLYFLENGITPNTDYFFEIWGKDPLTDYAQTFVPVSISNFETGEILERTENNIYNSKSAKSVLFTVSNILPTTGEDMYITHVFNKKLDDRALCYDSESKIATESGLEIYGNYAGKRFVVDTHTVNPLVKWTSNLNSNFEIRLTTSNNIDLVDGLTTEIVYQNKNEEKEGEDFPTHTIEGTLPVSVFSLVDYSSDATTATIAVDRKTILDYFDILDEDTSMYDIHIVSIAIGKVEGMFRTKTDSHAMYIYPVSANYPAKLKLEFANF